MFLKDFFDLFVCSFLFTIIKKTMIFYDEDNIEIRLRNLMSDVKALWLRCWISNPGVQCSKPLGGSKIDSAFHPSKVDKISTRNIWGHKVYFLNVFKGHVKIINISMVTFNVSILNRLKIMAFFL